MENNISPFKAYFTINNPHPHPITVNVGQPMGNFEGEKISDLKKEENITRELFKNPEIVRDLFYKMNINFPYCWVGIEVLREDIVSNWNFDSKKAGDIDLIIGNFFDDNKTPNLDYVVGVQIKTRKITSTDELKRFASGEGTEQSKNTVKLGFDKTYLFHLLIKDPSAPPLGFAEIWNTLSNSVHPQHMLRCLNAIKPRLENELYGYGIIGWAQAANQNWQYAGTIYDEIIKDAVYQPWRHQLEFEANRQKLISFLKDKIQTRKIDKYPFIFYDRKEKH